MSTSQHWEHIYSSRQPHEVSWTQQVPATSLQFIREFNLPHSARIIDIGGGDSHLVDFLLEEGYGNISVLDISENAIRRAKERLGEKAAKVNWIVSDILTFNPVDQYECWHDRATFHFLTEPHQIGTYLEIARKSVQGFMTIGTFSHNGPTHCSGLPIQQYNETELQQQLEAGFTKLRCITEDHTTPFNTQQNFLFCSFRSNPH